MYKTVVAGFHKSVTGREVVQHATALAATLGADLHLVTSFDPKAGDDARVDAERHLASQELGSVRPVQTHVLGGDIAKVIVEVAGNVDADLVVVGNKDLPGSKRTADSVAGAVSANTPCAVLIVPTI